MSTKLENSRIFRFEIVSITIRMSNDVIDNLRRNLQMIQKKSHFDFTAFISVSNKVSLSHIVGPGV